MAERPESGGRTAQSHTHIIKTTGNGTERGNQVDTRRGNTQGQDAVAQNIQEVKTPNRIHHTIRSRFATDLDRKFRGWVDEEANLTNLSVSRSIKYT